MKKLFPLFAIVLCMVASCSPAETIHGTYQGYLNIGTEVTHSQTMVSVQKIDNNHASIEFASADYYGTAPVVELLFVDNRVELYYTHMPAEGEIHYLDGNLKDGILYSNFKFTESGVEKQGNFQHGIRY